MKRRLFPFRYKLTLLITVIVVLLLGIVSILIEKETEREFRQLIQQQLLQTESVAHDQIKQRFEGLLSEALFLRGDPLIRKILTQQQFDESTRNDILNDEVYQSLAYADFVFVLNSEGKPRALTKGAEKFVEEITESQYFLPSLTGEDSVGYVSDETKYEQFISLPIFLGDTMLGIVVAGKYFVQSDLQRIKEVSNIDLALLETQKVTFFTDWKYRSDNSIKAIIAEFEKMAHEKQLFTSGKTHEMNLLGERFLMRYVQPGKNLMPNYALVQSLDYKLNFVSTINRYILLVSVIAAVIVAIIAFFFSISVSKPIRILREATAEIEKENFDHHVDIRTSDEFSRLADSFNNMTNELSEKKRVREAFDKSVSSDVAKHILEQGTALGGTRCDASILFLDIRGFTSLSERLSESELITLLNRYFSATSVPIHQAQGTIDKFIGDAIMVLFGIPTVDTKHAFHAVEAAQGIMKTLDDFNQEHSAQLGVKLDIGVGINTGSVIAGMVGAENRLNYTALGDNVNLASRIEGLTKSYGAHIIITQYTYDALGESDKKALLLRRIDRVQVKGKTEPCDIYEILCDTPSDSKRKAIAQFEQALDELRNHQLTDALVNFTSLQQQWPDDETIKKMMQRITDFKNNNALYQKSYVNGVYIHNTKG